MATDVPTIDAGALTEAGLTTPVQPRAFLVVYVDAGAGATSRVVELPDGAEVVFGRSRAVTIPVDHDKVSRQHARVTRRGGQIVVEDLGSRNGTRVNGEKLEGPQR